MWERKAMICYLYGYVSGHKKELTTFKDRLILVDQVMVNMNQPPITKEDKEWLNEELFAEVDWSYYALKINRKTSRAMVRGLKK